MSAATVLLDVLIGIREILVVLGAAAVIAAVVFVLLLLWGFVQLD